jgi:hypothetical protein
MSTDRDTTRIVRSWLRTDENDSADRVLGVVLDRLDTTPQHRSTLWQVRRPTVMTTTLKYGLAAAVLAISTVAGVALLSQAGGFGGPPEEPVPSTAAASVSPETQVLIAEWLEDANESGDYPCMFTPIRYEQVGTTTMVRVGFSQKPEDTCTSEYLDSEDTFIFVVSNGVIVDHP